MEKMIKNFELIEKDPLIIPSHKGLVYEVTRVINRAPLFSLGHYKRLINSLKSQNSNMILTYEDYKKAIDTLISSMDKDNFNIKTVIEPETKELYIFESPSSYPIKEQYDLGVDTTILKYERPNPNAKVVNVDLTSKARELMEEKNVYEVILVDSNNNITEGSRSNLFFIKDNALITPPVNAVLPGITRLKIMETMNNIGVKVLEREINVNELPSFTGAFISGTSPKILPIKSIDSLEFNVKDNPFIKSLIDAFQKTIEEDINTYKNEV